MKTALKNNRRIQRPLVTLIFGCAFIFVFVHTAFAQAPSPTPTTGRGGVAPQAQIETLTESARTFVPSIKRIIEGQLLRRYALLATVLAQLIMMASLIKLMAEKTGPTRDFFGFVGRAIIVLPLILMGPWLITYSYKLGQQLTSPLSSPLRDVRQNFDEQYAEWISGHFLVPDTTGTYVPLQDGRAALVGVLQDQTTTVRSVDQMLQGSFWDMPKLFTVMNIARGIIGFADFLLIVLTGFLMIAFRLAVPWMLAVCVDKSLAHEITYKFARGVIVFTLVFPVVANIMRFIGYSLGNLGMGLYDVRQMPPMYYMDPRTAQILAESAYDPTFTFGVAAFMILVTALCLLASPVISYKIAFGQTFEGVASVASGWMAAIIGTGLNFVSAKIGAALNSAAERLHVQATADAGVITTRAEAANARTMTNLGLQRDLMGIGATNTLHQRLNNANASQTVRNLQLALTQEVSNYGANAQAARQLHGISGDQTTMSAGVATIREQDFAELQFRTGDRLVDEQWNAQRWGAAGSILGARGGARNGAGGAATGGAVGSTVGQYGVLSVQKGNLEHIRDETIGITNEAMARKTNNTNAIVERQQGVEDTRYSAMTDAARERTGGQVAATYSWRAEANQATQQFADTQAGAARTFAEGATAAIDARYVEQNHAIEVSRQAGMQAAEHHRVAQILSQVTHDMTRRIEEMGQYRF